MILAIASGKGGTGKTTLSTNLASYLAKTRKTVLVDLDVEEPNSGLFLSTELTHSEVKHKMIPNWDETACTLCGECQQLCNFNALIQLGDQILVFPQLCHSCFACSELCPAGALPMTQQRIGTINEYTNGNLEFIESRLDIGQEQAVPLIRQTLELILEEFSENDLIILDAPPGTSCPVIESIKEADFVILVTEPTPFGLHDLKLAIETTKGLGKDFGVVINRHGIGNDDVLKYCSMENIRILAKIPNSRQIAELYSQGRLIYTEFPAFSSALEDIVKQIGIYAEGRQQ
jgi:MinD superfamily P-loop ATPase